MTTGRSFTHWTEIRMCWAALAPDLGDGVRQVDCIDLSMEPALYEQAACMVLVKAAFGSDEFPHG